MDANFWHQRWENNQIGFHENEANPLLITYFKELYLAKGSRAFVPLCGKTLSIAWLLAKGYRVAGAELSELAIKQLFAELGTEPRITAVGAIKHYSARAIDIFVGDIFDVTHEMLGPVDAVFDRAALVALPEPIRIRYAHHLIDLTDRAPQLLITYDYDQMLRQGPPFSISDEEIKQHYQATYEITPLVRIDLTGAMREAGEVTENVWLLKARTTQNRDEST